MPSAMVVIDRSATGWPARSDSGYAAAPSAWTPITVTPGFFALTAIAIPASTPPPPHGTTTVSTSGACSTISSPTVPWPATTSVLSKGWISTAPVCSSNSRAADRASSR